MKFHAVGCLPSLERVPGGFGNGYCCCHRHGGVRVRVLCLFVAGREVKNSVLSVKSRKGVNGSHEMANVRGQEGMWSGVGMVSLSWPFVGVRIRRVWNQFGRKIAKVRDQEYILFFVICRIKSQS